MNVVAKESYAELGIAEEEIQEINTIHGLQNQITDHLDKILYIIYLSMSSLQTFGTS